MMPVEINQWRATIGCFRVSIQKLSPLKKSVKPFSVFLQILKLFWFCYSFIAISILALPFTLTIQFLTVHCVTTQSPFLPLFARVHHIAKTVLYTTIELFKRIPLGVIGLVRYKHATVRQFLFLYAYCYIGMGMGLEFLVMFSIVLSFRPFWSGFPYCLFRAVRLSHLFPVRQRQIWLPLQVHPSLCRPLLYFSL